MDVHFAVIADAANVSREGKLNVLGMFNAIHSAAFPAMHPQMQLVVQFDAKKFDEGRKKPIDVEVLEADGRKIFAFHTEMVVPKGEPGYPIRVNFIHTLTGVKFDKPGDYEINILVDREVKGTVPLRVAEVRKPR